MSEPTTTEETTEETEEVKQTQSQIDLARAVALVKPKASAGASDDDMLIDVDKTKLEQQLAHERAQRERFEQRLHILEAAVIKKGIRELNTKVA